MQTTEALRVYDQFEGNGQVYDGDQLVANVHYSIRDVAEMLEPLHAEGETAAGVVGQRNICGILRPAKEGILARYVGARLLLRLQDGRLLPFTVARDMARSCLLQGLGEFRRPG